MNTPLVCILSNSLGYQTDRAADTPAEKVLEVRRGHPGCLGVVVGRGVTKRGRKEEQAGGFAVDEAEAAAWTGRQRGELGCRQEGEEGQEELAPRTPKTGLHKNDEQGVVEQQF